jgi:hypothetical protein
MQKRIKGGTIVGWIEEPVEVKIDGEPKTEKPKKTTAKKRATKAAKE